jgi:hypothetical protein
MNKIVIGICLAAFVLSGCTKDSTYNCVGTIVQDYTFETKYPSHFEYEDKIGLVIEAKHIVLVGIEQLYVPKIYEENGKSNFDYSFPICKNKNYEVFANNYSCDIDVIKNAENYEMAEKFEIKFNGLTNVLSVLMEPTIDKRMQLSKNKISYQIQRAKYQCKPVSTSF